MILTQRDQDLIDAVRSIATQYAAPNADDVDRNARFPRETVDALKAQRALSALVPEEFDGGGASIGAVAQCCLELGRSCAASAMVFAMHHIQVATIVRQLERGQWFDDYLRRLCAEQRLVASVTSEVGTGGDMGRSVASVEPLAAGRSRFQKNATTVSYGAFADDLLTTLRRAPAADPGDQVAVLTSKDQYTLEQTGTWDVLGMRGTCSPGCVVTAEFEDAQVLPGRFATHAAESMVPVSHILWSHIWLGIAEDAFSRARAFVRADAKRRGEVPAVNGQRLARLLADLSMLRAGVGAVLANFERACEADDREQLSAFTTMLMYNNLKLTASERSVAICQAALETCGIVGFKNDSPFSIGRHLRDSLSAPLMITNDRLRETNANLMLIAKEV
jgi:acyl-CoA dehydrogenase